MPQNLGSAGVTTANTGNPDVVALDAAIKAVASEAAKINSGSLGNAPTTDAANKAADKLAQFIEASQG